MQPLAPAALSASTRAAATSCHTQILCESAISLLLSSDHACYHLKCAWQQHEHRACLPADHTRVGLYSWYKRKPADQVIFNEGNTAATYNEQRLFLASGLNRSTRLLGGGTFSGGNQVYAHKHGDHSAEMA